LEEVWTARAGEVPSRRGSLDRFQIPKTAGAAARGAIVAPEPEGTVHPQGTGRRATGYAAMRRALDIEAIFPINDSASAALMAIKADRLYHAGIINKREKEWVEDRVRTFLDDAVLEDAA
jgi:hypothetical protein